MKPRIAITCAPDDALNPAARADYRRAIEQAGGDAEFVCGTYGPQALAALLRKYDGLLLPGGHDVSPEAYGGRMHPKVKPEDPARDQLELYAASRARDEELPTLGICRGMQVINVALGGTVYEDIEEQHQPLGGLRLRHQQTPEHSRHEPTHAVDLQVGSKLAALFGATKVDTNSMHHQAVRRIAYDLKAVGKTRDGIVEALELRGAHPFFVGVQWHPEEMVERDEPSRRLFVEFVACAARRARRSAGASS